MALVRLFENLAILFCLSLVVTHARSASVYGHRAVRRQPTEKEVTITKSSQDSSYSIPEDYTYRIKSLNDLKNYPDAAYKKPTNFAFDYKPSNINELVDKKENPTPYDVLRLILIDKFDRKLDDEITNEFLTLYWRYLMCRRGVNITANCPDPCKNPNVCKGIGEKIGTCRSYQEGNLEQDTKEDTKHEWARIFQVYHTCECEASMAWSKANHGCADSTGLDVGQHEKIFENLSHKKLVTASEQMRSKSGGNSNAQKHMNSVQPTGDELPPFTGTMVEKILGSKQETEEDPIFSPPGDSSSSKEGAPATSLPNRRRRSQKRVKRQGKLTQAEIESLFATDPVYVKKPRYYHPNLQGFGSRYAKLSNDEIEKLFDTGVGSLAQNNNHKTKVDIDYDVHFGTDLESMTDAQIESLFDTAMPSGVTNDKAKMRLEAYKGFDETLSDDDIEALFATSLFPHKWRRSLGAFNRKKRSIAESQKIHPLQKKEFIRKPVYQQGLGYVTNTDNQENPVKPQDWKLNPDEDDNLINISL